MTGFHRTSRQWLAAYPLALLFSALLVACDDSERPRGEPPIVPGAAATAARLAATANPTPVRTATAEPVPTQEPRPTSTPGGPSDDELRAAAVSQIRTALESGKLDDLKPLMLDSISVAFGDEQSTETMDRDLALSWLAERLGTPAATPAGGEEQATPEAQAAAAPRVITDNLVENYGLLEVVTGPWKTLPPAKGETIIFNLHRFNEQGDQDIIHGDWKIDTLRAQ